MKKRLYIGVGIVLVVLAGLVIWYFGFNFEGKSEDAKRFKSAYESYNNMTNSEGTKYQSIKVDKSNKVKYVTLDEAVNALNSDKALIYFCKPDENACRSTVNTLLNAVDSSDLESLLYLDLTNVRDTYKLVDGTPVKSVDGQDGYYELLKKLDTYLDDYLLIDDRGYYIATGEKRIEMPLVVGVKRGEIVGTVNHKVNANDYESRVSDLIKNVLKNSNVCDEEC